MAELFRAPDRGPATESGSHAGSPEHCSHPGARDRPGRREASQPWTVRARQCATQPCVATPPAPADVRQSDAPVQRTRCSIRHGLSTSADVPAQVEYSFWPSMRRAAGRYSTSCSKAGPQRRMMKLPSRAAGSRCGHDLVEDRVWSTTKTMSAGGQFVACADHRMTVTPLRFPDRKLEVVVRKARGPRRPGYPCPTIIMRLGSRGDVQACCWARYGGAGARRW